MTIGYIDINTLQGTTSVYVKKNCFKAKVRMEYRNAVIVGGVILLLLGLIGMTGLFSAAVTPIAVAADQSITYLIPNSANVNQAPAQFAYYYFTNGHNAVLAIEQAAVDLGLGWLVSTLTEGVIGPLSATGAFADSVNGLAKTAAQLFVDSLPWWGYALIGYAAAFGAL